MARAKVDWPYHLSQFAASSQNAPQYCAAAGINLGSFRYHLYKQRSKQEGRSKFREFTVSSELIISRDQRGLLTISGIELAQLPDIVGAWSDALS